VLTINEPKASQKKGEYKEQNGSTHVQETHEPPKKVDHKENIKFPNPLPSQEAY
jgi:hypothetical protein